jgi:hypothetical protein
MFVTLNQTIINGPVSLEVFQDLRSFVNGDTLLVGNYKDLETCIRQEPRLVIEAWKDLLWFGFPIQTAEEQFGTVDPVEIIAHLSHSFERERKNTLFLQACRMTGADPAQGFR